jgi:hypothetical protein
MVINGYLVYFVAIWYIFPPFWHAVQRKIWQPCCKGFLRGLMMEKVGLFYIHFEYITAVWSLYGNAVIY